MNSNSAQVGTTILTIISMIMPFLIIIFNFILWGVTTIVGIAMIAICMLSNWKIFEKMGRQGWEGIVPYYNTWIMAEKFTTNNTLWFILSIAPMTNMVALVVLLIGLYKAFGKSTGFIVFAMFFPYIAAPMVAFGKSEYIGYKFNF